MKVSKAIARDSGRKGTEMTKINVPSQNEPKVHVVNIPLDMTEVSETSHFFCSVIEKSIRPLYIYLISQFIISTCTSFCQ